MDRQDYTTFDNYLDQAEDSLKEIIEHITEYEISLEEFNQLRRIAELGEQMSRLRFKRVDDKHKAC